MSAHIFFNIWIPRVDMLYQLKNWKKIYIFKESIRDKHIILPLTYMGSSFPRKPTFTFHTVYLIVMSVQVKQSMSLYISLEMFFAYLRWHIYFSFKLSQICNYLSACSRRPDTWQYGKFHRMKSLTLFSFQYIITISGITPIQFSQFIEDN